jgi:hypothetical protein
MEKKRGTRDKEEKERERESRGRVGFAGGNANDKRQGNFRRAD